MKSTKKTKHEYIKQDKENIGHDNTTSALKLISVGLMPREIWRGCLHLLVVVPNGNFSALRTKLLCAFGFEKANTYFHITKVARGRKLFQICWDCAKVILLIVNDQIPSNNFGVVHS